MVLALGNLLWPLKINIELNSLDEAVASCENIRNKLLSGNENEFTLTVYCCDFQQYKKTFRINVTPLMNVDDLKKHFFKQYSFADPVYQCWIIGNRIPQDYEYLKHLGITQENSEAHLLLRKDGYKHRNYEWLDINVEAKSFATILDQLDLAEQAIKIKEWDEALDRLDDLQDLLPSAIFNLQVHIEDVNDVYTKVLLPVSSDMSFKELSSLASKSFSIPKSLIKWVYGRWVIKHDCDEFLSQMNISASKPKIHLFVVSPESAGVSVSDIQVMHEKLVTNFIDSRSSSISIDEKSIDMTQESHVLQEVNTSQEVAESNLLDTMPLQTPPQKSEPIIAMWGCEFCTVKNLPLMRICSVCGGGKRPPDFEVPADYNPTPEELQHETAMKQSEENELLTMRLLETEKQNIALQAGEAYQQYLQIDDTAVVFNNEEIECPICLSDIDPGDAIILRECLHPVCVDCLQQLVINADTVTIKCPTQTDTFACDAVINDREIAAIVPEEEFHKYKRRGLMTAEATLPSFHCRTANCDSWWEIAGEVNSYKCELCGQVNCIVCKAIHMNMTCKEYQDDLRIRAENDETAKATQMAVDNMIKTGEAMYCPKCKLVIQKSVGCDWMQCSMCQTELCWATKGPRWGPRGHGDTSGGCRCGVNGTRCTPTCNYCH